MFDLDKEQIIDCWVPASPRVVVNRLTSHVGGAMDSKIFIGQVTSQGFTVRRSHPQQRLLRPMMEGRLLEVDGGTRVVGTCQVGPQAQLVSLGLVPLVMVLIGGAGAFSASRPTVTGSLQDQLLPIAVALFLGLVTSFLMRMMLLGQAVDGRENTHAAMLEFLRSNWPDAQI